jgi:hypothetical protein
MKLRQNDNQRAAGILPAVLLATDASFCRQDAGSTFFALVIK